VLHRVRRAAGPGAGRCRWQACGSRRPGQKAGRGCLGVVCCFMGQNTGGWCGRVQGWEWLGERPSMPLHKSVVAAAAAVVIIQPNPPPSSLCMLHPSRHLVSHRPLIVPACLRLFHGVDQPAERLLQITLFSCGGGEGHGCQALDRRVIPLGHDCCCFAFRDAKQVCTLHTLYTRSSSPAAA